LVSLWFPFGFATSDGSIPCNLYTALGALQSLEFDASCDKLLQFYSSIVLQLLRQKSANADIRWMEGVAAAVHA
jgi:hypothetical protein